MHTNVRMGRFLYIPVLCNDFLSFFPRSNNNVIVCARRILDEGWFEDITLYVDGVDDQPLNQTKQPKTNGSRRLHFILYNR